MRVQRVYNAALVQGLVTTREVWARVAEDGINPIQWSIDTEHTIAIALIDEDRLHGFVLGSLMTTTIASTETVIDPDVFGKKANVSLVRLGAQEVLKESPLQTKLVELVPVPDKGQLRLLQQAGYQREGILKESFRRDGEFVDQYVLGYRA